MFPLLTPTRLALGNILDKNIPDAVDWFIPGGAWEERSASRLSIR